MKKKSTPNQTKGRGSQKPEYIVIHMTEGSEDSAINWIENIKSQVSYHYLIGKKGNITQFVEVEDTAWHAGLIVKSTWEGLKKGINPNQYTIGIACAGFADIGPTIEQYASASLLVRWLSKKYDIKLDGKTIIPHNRIRTDKTCPGEKFDPQILNHLASLSEA